MLRVKPLLRRQRAPKVVEAVAVVDSQAMNKVRDLILGLGPTPAWVKRPSQTLKKIRFVNCLTNAAFRDRNAGANNNRTKPTGDDGVRQDRHPRGDRAPGSYNDRGRGGRGRGGRGGNYDRHSRTVGG
jgi:hypothetical protein